MTLDKIQNGAQNLIFLHGIKGWSMDDMAVETGLTKRTIYKYIHSKEDLVRNVLLDYIKRAHYELLTQLREQPDLLSGLDIILNIFPDMIMRFNSKVIENILKQYPAIEAHLIENRERITADIKEYMIGMQEKGFIKQEVNADTMLEIIQSLIIYYSKSNPDQLGDKIRESLKMVLYGVLQEGSK
jgi:AcrR family transcriptional regulator